MTVLATFARVYADDLDAALAALAASGITEVRLRFGHAAGRSVGARTVREPAEQEVGRNATVAFPAGPTVEYVEWNPATRAAVGL